MVTSLLVSFASWEASAIDDVLRILLIIELATDLGKSSHEANLLIVLISDSKLFVEQIWNPCVARLKIHEVQYVQGTKLVTSIPRLVFVSF